MSIKYKMIHRGDYLNPEEKKKSGYYPQVIRSGTVNLEEMATIIAKGKRLQAFEIKSTLELLIACIEDELGWKKCLPGWVWHFLAYSSKRSSGGEPEGNTG